jgi:tRNA threonylcarbamoyladenosine biosynthesis protein TsaB
VKILAIETATLMGGVAITSDEGIIGEVRVSVRTTHSEQLMTIIDRVLKSSQTSLMEMDAFAVSIGPGSFTGLRIGVSTVKGFSMITTRPVLPISTLEGLSFSLPFSTHPICPILDAKKGEVYTALFHFNGTNQMERLWEDQVMSPSELSRKITQPTLLLGNGLQIYGKQLKEALGDKAIFSPKRLWAPSALSIAELARQMWREGTRVPSDAVKPNYVRRSEAEVKWELQQQKKTSGDISQ